MAERDNLQSQDPDAASTASTSSPRRSSKFSQIMHSTSSFGTKLRKSISKAVVQTKVSAMHKLSRAEYLEEDPHVVVALEQLKETKNSIRILARHSRKVYSSAIAHAKTETQLGNVMREMEFEPTYQFESVVKTLGDTYNDVELETRDLLECFYENVVLPLENFLNVDIDRCQQLKLEYKQVKANYDVAVKNHDSLCNKENVKQDKVATAQQRKYDCEVELKSTRQTLQDAIKSLLRKKDKEVMAHVTTYWGKYVEYCRAVYHTTSKLDVPKLRASLQTRDDDSSLSANNPFNPLSHEAPPAIKPHPFKPMTSQDPMTEAVEVYEDEEPGRYPPPPPKPLFPDNAFEEEELEEVAVDIN